MNRRKFVRTLLTAGVAAAPLIAPRRARCQTPAALQQSSYPEMRILTTESFYIDGRPAFSPDGSLVLFERSAPPSYAQTSFYVINTTGGRAVPLVPKNLPTGLSFTRPDWSWNRSSYPIIFSGNLPATQQASVQWNIYVLDLSTRTIECVLPGVASMNQIYSYPSWYPDGVHASITNYYWVRPNPLPDLNKLDVQDGSLTALTDPGAIWPGMSSVAQLAQFDDPPIAFAGMTPQSANNGVYNQDENQIWLRLPGGQLQQVQTLQARAPWWSPDGRFLAFESNRMSRSYQIFLQNPYEPAEFTAAVTPPGLYVQHAKWSPDGTKIVFAYSHDGEYWGIAYIVNPFAG